MALYATNPRRGAAAAGQTAFSFGATSGRKPAKKTRPKSRARRAATRAPAVAYMPGADAGPFPAASGRRTRKLRAVRIADLRTRRMYWADPRDGTAIVGSMWKWYRRPARRKKAAARSAPATKGRKKKAAARKPTAKKKTGRKAAARKTSTTRKATRRSPKLTARRAAGAARRIKRWPRGRGLPAVLGTVARGSSRTRGRLPRGHRRRVLRALARRRRGRKNLFARTTIRKGQLVAGLVRRNPRNGRFEMSRAVANGRRRRRRRAHRAHRRRNPAFGGILGTVKNTVKTAIPAVAGGALMSIVDAKLLAGRSMPLRIAGKVAAAVAVTMLLRSRPVTAQVLQGAMLGTLGYELGANLAGGIVAPNKTEAQKSVAGLIRAEPAMAGLVGADGYPMSSLPTYDFNDVNLG